ncbi:MAG: hypothetical protein A2806_02240 [Candidatus Terrybacteria bacterium RIFCSPHIGHO2_01_FULL_48_17]|uniref:Excinuclease ABC subunit C n=1 Tax=Candidatus Terrybacteria bacterium RIFCSPHIGHO2_01_FULL_48_17 TaxID=1802362 RepID=A0A1G2PJM0_9BACT|nr:MAG: hypothetical protein A2806_02240 [Candidatus Terrybacteria bacterium RIFCSPHIGHO2_01_FULL_48_17]OHA53567.1 MAG: hypothetical protein A3A30_00195 [Candidatus Terrybacteria bacterium RIFCSPLOWO2_01_FULL_48_14]
MAVNVSKAPQTPGVYFFLDRKGKILYIGKATNLRSRLQSYFRKNAELEPVKRAMVNKIAGFRVQGTESEIEALILEAKLIKKNRPPYNVLLRDDKTYLSVGFTKEEFPRVVYVRRNTEGLETIIGPFTDAAALKKTLRLLRRIFPYAAHKGIPKHCLWYDLGLCPIPYKLPENKDQLSTLKKRYRRNIENIQAVLRGQKTDLLKKLEKEMGETAYKEDFEKAANIRDEIYGLARIFEHKTVLEAHHTRYKTRDTKLLGGLPPGLHSILPQNEPTTWRIEGYDISNIQGTAATASMVVFDGTRINTNGKTNLHKYLTPNKNEYRKFRIKTVVGANDVAMIKEVLMRRIRHTEWALPDIILIDGGKPQLNTALVALQGLRYRVQKKPLVLALAKKHEEIYVPDKKEPIGLPQNHPFRLLLMHVRDEAHRFARAYHHKLREIK